MPARLWLERRLRRRFARLHEPSNGLAHSHHGTFRCRHARENAFTGRLDFDDRFIGFDFEQRLAFSDAIAFFFRQLRILPVSWAISSAGMMTLIAMISGARKRALARDFDAFGSGAGFDHLYHALAARRFAFALGWQRPVDAHVVRAGHHEFLRREARNHFVARGRNDNFLLNTRGAPPIGRGPERFERENHPRLDLVRVFE